MGDKALWETKHAYLGDYPISKDAEYLILGTIHPYQGEDICKKGRVFQPAVDFFYGNDYTLWQILAETFKTNLSLNITKSSSDSDKAQALKNILAFLQKNKIAVSDTVQSCMRKPTENCTPNASDSAILNDENLVLNEDLLKQIKDKKIKRIFFTSRRTSVFFSRIMRDSQAQAPIKDLKTPSLISKLFVGEELEITSSLFNNIIKAVILPSPSGNGVRGQARLYRESKYYSTKDYNGWRKEIYQKAFAGILS